jgi:methylphosphotriester-DNA--protein-cysteine methyltransferase
MRSATLPPARTVRKFVCGFSEEDETNLLWRSRKVGWTSFWLELTARMFSARTGYSDLVSRSRTRCRPICLARTPRRENITFYRSAAAAQEAGFRPCLRCRPETAPDLGAWRGTSNTVSRALALVEMGALDEAGVERLAERLRVGERHLRRLFRRHLGAPPVAVAQTRRVLLAKQLIHETSLPMVEIALAAGFAASAGSTKPSINCSAGRLGFCAAAGRRNLHPD